ncbi:polysaccharide deacetylase family protein [Halopiger xanaduensis]|uniref:Polysaccharide deacetylase n=1 Tax=Halopiger xanaduensis (strain DSM 18323 / JCM 14033 / SH-6) TaxID=797210 RepID=F8DA21_HALXS|nr:polysaccharide deacetylase [Halopiger xanaduensis SH-6]
MVVRRRTYLSITASAVAGVAGCIASRSTSSDHTSSDESASASDDTRASLPDEEGGSPSDDTAVDQPDDAGTHDDFENLETWDITGGTLTADPNRSVVGSQSAGVEVPASRGPTRLAKTFAEPRDLADVVPGVAVAADDVVVPWVRLVDAEGNSIGYRRSIGVDLPLMRYNFGIEALDTAFDATSVCEVHIQLWTAEGETRTVWFDDFHVTPRPETGAVMIQFDDGSATDYTEALPILEDYGYPAATFVNSESIDSGEQWLTTDQLYELDDAGWCIGNHTRSHGRLPELNIAEQAAEIREGKQWLVERGFEDGAEYFAYPYGRYDATTLELVDEHHAIGFAGGRPVQGYTTNTRLASRISEPSIDRLETVLERTAEQRGITTVLYHQLEGEDLAAFERLVEMLHEYESRGELEVILPTDLEERFLF